jgi:arylsulfatase A-like enzyme
MAAEGAPNILYIVLDDVGFSAMEPFGGLIETPNIKRLVDPRTLIPPEVGK